MLNSESLNFTFSTGTIMILPHHHHHNLVHRPSLCVSHYISSARVASKAMSPGNPPTGHSGIKWHFNHEKKSSVMKANLQATNLTIVSTKEETTIRKQQQKRINNNKKTTTKTISTNKNRQHDSTKITCNVFFFRKKKKWLLIALNDGLTWSAIH